MMFSFADDLREEIMSYTKRTCEVIYRTRPKQDKIQATKFVYPNDMKMSTAGFYY